jgi:membrane fusion protein, multidrug efflux system
MKRIATVIMVFSIIFCLACTKDRPGADSGEKVSDERVLVQTKLMSPEPFAHYLTINGAVEAVGEAYVSPETAGRIMTFHVVEGQRVRKGQLLVSLNADAMRSGIAELESGLDLARVVYQRRRELWDKKIGSEIQYLEAKTNLESLENRLESLQAQLEMAEIKAPISGIVDRIESKQGELAMPGMVLLHLVDLQKMRLNAELAESYLGRVKSGDQVEVSFPTYPGLSRSETIGRISQTINPKNRTVIIQVEMTNEDELIKPNMMASLKLNDFMDAEALVLPSIIIKSDLQGSFVYLLEGSGEKAVARKVYIETGLSYEGRTMVLDGLQAGRQVIVAGYNLVSNGMPVRVR